MTSGAACSTSPVGGFQESSAWAAGLVGGATTRRAGGRVRQAIKVAKRAFRFCRLTPVSTEHAIPSWTGEVRPGTWPWIHHHAERHGDAPDLKCSGTVNASMKGGSRSVRIAVKPALAPPIQGRPTRFGPHRGTRGSRIADLVQARGPGRGVVSCPMSPRRPTRIVRSY